MNYFKQFIAAYHLARQIRQYNAMADAANFWTEEDGIHLRTFLLSHTGKKFRARLSNIVFISAIRACENADAGEWRRGIAHGVNSTVQFIETHLPRPVVEQKPAEDQNIEEVSRTSYEPVLQ